MHDPAVNTMSGWVMPFRRSVRIIWWLRTIRCWPSAEGIPFKNAAPLGFIEAQPARSLNDEKMRQFYILEKITSFEKVIGYCFFGPAPRSYILLEEMVESVNDAAGWDLSLDDILEIGERATNLARVFNAREGFTRKDDTLPERCSAPWKTALWRENPSHATNSNRLSQCYTV